MGKASKWFRGLLGLKKQDSPSSSTAVPPPSKPPKDKRRWSFVKSYRENNHASAHPTGHAVAVAAATTAVAEAAAVARLRSAVVLRDEWAAIKIQAAFRGCLARRALRALRGLVKLQALVRGHIERKRTAEWLQRMQALLQANARVRRAQILHTSRFSTGHLHAPTTPDKFESPITSRSMKCDPSSSSALKRNGSKSRFQIGSPAKCENRSSDIGADERSPWNQRRSWTRTCSMDDERSVRILGIDSHKPHMVSSKRRNLFYSASQPLVPDHYSQSYTTTKDSTSYQSGQSPSSGEIRSYSPLKFNEIEDSPQIFSTSYKEGGNGRSPYTPTKSDGTGSYLSSYADYPNYMAYTESSKAKVRSLSAPKLRPQYERPTSFNRYLLHAPFGESQLVAQRVSALRASFTSKAYPGSGHLDNFGLPVGYRC